MSMGYDAALPGAPAAGSGMNAWKGLGTGVSIGAAAFQTATAYTSASTENMALGLQRMVAKSNKSMAEFQARESIDMGYASAAAYSRQVSDVVGKQRAARAKSGVLLGAGSAGDAEAETRATGERGIQLTKFNAKKSAWAHQVEARNYELQAISAKAQMRSPWLAAFGAGMSGAASAAATIAR